MPESHISLAPPRQLRLAGITVGVLWIGSDPARPEAGVGVFNPDTRRPETRRMRPGDAVEVAGRTVRVEAIEVRDRPEVRLRVSWAD